MPSILAKRHLSTLGRFAQSNVLLAFDYDGTLAPIAATPERAHMRQATRRLLTEVAHRYPCVVISGRRLGDVRARLHDVPLSQIFGNHGLEPLSATKATAALVRRWADMLEQSLPAYDGLVIEKKAYSLTIHYRHVREKTRAIRMIQEAIAKLPDARPVGGTLAVSLIPRDGPDKGVALRHALRHFACDAALFVGDDDTDEDAFGAAEPERLLAIRVGAKRQTRARYWIRSQADIDLLLRALILQRAKGKGQR